MSKEFNICEEGRSIQSFDLSLFNSLAGLASAVVHYGDQSPMKNGVFAEAERLLFLIENQGAITKHTTATGQ